MTLSCDIATTFAVTRPQSDLAIQRDAHDFMRFSFGGGSKNDP